MKVLMFGWEFPPFNTGGLGTACYGLTKGMKSHDTQISFVLPKADSSLEADFVDIVSASDTDIKKIKVSSPIMPYMTPEEYQQEVISRGKSSKAGSIYGKDLFEEVRRYAAKASLIARQGSFDIIHAHDWMTYEAGINARKVSGKPLVIHVHATEFDRTGNTPNPGVYDIEKKGMQEADSIIAVSRLTKRRIIENYGISPEKIEVVHNAVEFNENKFDDEDFAIKGHDKIVLFLGRITMQKGPDYFLDAAKKALEVRKDIKFIIAGSGDMERFIIEKAAGLGISDKVLFAGFLRGKDIDRAYQMADLYVMPSVSEPFGITPLEAMRNNTPVIISKQSGVSEVIDHCIKVDFWDTKKLAAKMLSILSYQELHEELKKNGNTEIRKFNWNEPARRCIDIYSRTIGNIRGDQHS